MLGALFPGYFGEGKKKAREIKFLSFLLFSFLRKVSRTEDVENLQSDHKIWPFLQPQIHRQMDASPSARELGYKLVTACREGDLAKVVRLVEAGADVNVAGPMNRTTLMIAALFGHLEICLHLVDHNAHLDQQVFPFLYYFYLKKNKFSYYCLINFHSF